MDDERKSRLERGDERRAETCPVPVRITSPTICLVELPELLYLVIAMAILSYMYLLYGYA